jgi:hypothetical protein
MANIRLEAGSFGWDYLIVNVDTGDDILVQTDWDYPGVASTFGWGDYTDNPDEDIPAAQEFLDENIGAVMEDPGYFE